MTFSIAQWFRVTTIGLAMLPGVAAIGAQPYANTTQKTEPSSFSGKYEGTVKDETGEAKLTLDVAETSGKFSGTLTTPRGVFKIIEGQLTEGSLSLRIEKPDSGSGLMTLRHTGSNLTASFTDSGKNLTVELHKAVADEISGDWDAVADAQGQAFPFTLSLKLDGDKVTGASDSQLGHANVVSGSWKDGKFSVLLDGNIALVATMIEGKLSGEYDYNGQGSGKWVAVRKK